MISYPEIDPVIVQVGPLALRWYGLMYLIGFVASYILVRVQLAEERVSDPAARIAALDALVFWLVIGVIAGGRFGYVLFYGGTYYLDHPLEIFATWQGGMSFHGGAAGAVLAGYAFCLKRREDFWAWSDRFVVTVPVGLGFGRIGNFINGELYGRPSDVPWAMIFPGGGLVPRHPSQIYEAFLEGLILFIVLWHLRKRPWPGGRKLALFLILYGMVRIFAEFFREPDAHIGFVAFGFLTMGQMLSIALIAVGLGLWWWRGYAPRLSIR